MPAQGSERGATLEMLEATLDENGNLHLPAEVVARLGLGVGQRLKVSVPRAGDGKDSSVEVVLQARADLDTLAQPLARMDLEEARSVLETRTAWAERDDIGDSAAFVRELRAGLDTRTERLEGLWASDDPA